MTTPPLVESLLTSLGATAECRDAVLGDLAEELATRASRDGVRAARAWYYREAMRSAPHLLASGMRAWRWPDVTRLAGIAATAWVLVAMSAGIPLVILVSTVTRFWPEHGAFVTPGLSALGLTMGLNGFGSVAGGYVAAWLDRRAPLVSALTLGTTWALVNVAMVLFNARVPVPTWYLYVASSIMFAGAVAGGILQVRARSRDTVAASA